MWERSTYLESLPMKEALEIIDDAMCMGFIFKVENKCIYFQEVIDK